MPNDYSGYDQWSCESSTKKGKFYKVTYIPESDKYICGCPASIYQKKICNHIEMVIKWKHEGICTERGPHLVIKESDTSGEERADAVRFTKENFLEEISKVI